MLVGHGGKKILPFPYFQAITIQDTVDDAPECGVSPLGGNLRRRRQRASLLPVGRKVYRSCRNLRLFRRRVALCLMTLPHPGAVTSTASLLWMRLGRHQR